MRVYYEKRAAEYDDWWRGTGLFAAQRAAFLALPRSSELIVVDSALRPRGEVLYDGPWFVAARSSSPRS